MSQLYLSSVLSNFADAGGGILADDHIGVGEADKDLGEDLGLNHHLSKVHVVLRDLAQAPSHLIWRSRKGATNRHKSILTQIAHSERVEHENPLVTA